MKIQALIKGLHHVTATVDDAHEDYQFYTQVLGLRLVKKTVNFDNNQVYHFYYGNQLGTPGTIMTTFPYKGQGVRKGALGTGQVHITSFSVPSTALDFWKDRLTSQGIIWEAKDRFGKATIQFDDPSGLILALVSDDEDGRTPWVTSEINQAVGIRGIHSVTLLVYELAPTLEFLENTLGARKIMQNGENELLYAIGEAGAGQYLGIIRDEKAPMGKNGIGTVHHVAWRVESEEALQALRTHLVETLQMNVTEVKDRNYFRSIYFRIPSNVLFEVATIPPGFTIDESEEDLGKALKLPAWEEANRADIEQVLPKI